MHTKVWKVIHHHSPYPLHHRVEQTTAVLTAWRLKSHYGNSRVDFSKTSVAKIVGEIRSLKVFYKTGIMLRKLDAGTGVSPEDSGNLFHYKSVFFFSFAMTMRNFNKKRLNGQLTMRET